MVDNDFLTRLYNQVQYQIANGIPVEDSQSNYLYLHGITLDFVAPPSVIGIPDDEDASPLFGASALTGAKEQYQSWKRKTGMNRVEPRGIKKSRIVKL